MLARLLLVVPAVLALAIPAQAAFAAAAGISRTPRWARGPGQAALRRGDDRRLPQRGSPRLRAGGGLEAHRGPRSRRGPRRDARPDDELQRRGADGHACRTAGL